MRTRVSLIVTVVGVGFWTANAFAESPAQIYSHYVQTGRLSCSLSHADLERVLSSGTINQYGDPLTLARLKLAVRRQLAGGCKRGASPSNSSGSPTSGSGTRKAHSKSHRHSEKKKNPAKAGKRPDRVPARVSKASAGGGNGSFVAGRAVIVGVLALALAFGGWLTKRGLSARG